MTSVRGEQEHEKQRCDARITTMLNSIRASVDLVFRLLGLAAPLAATLPAWSRDSRLYVQWINAEQKMRDHKVKEHAANLFADMLHHVKATADAALASYGRTLSEPQRRAVARFLVLDVLANPTHGLLHAECRTNMTKFNVFCWQAYKKKRSNFCRALEELIGHAALRQAQEDGIFPRKVGDAKGSKMREEYQKLASMERGRAQERCRRMFQSWMPRRDAALEPMAVDEPVPEVAHAARSSPGAVNGGLPPAVARSDVDAQWAPLRQHQDAPPHMGACAACAHWQDELHRERSELALLRRDLAAEQNLRRQVLAMREQMLGVLQQHTEQLQHARARANEEAQACTDALTRTAHMMQALSNAATADHPRASSQPGASFPASPLVLQDLQPRSTEPLFSMTPSFVSPRESMGGWPHAGMDVTGEAWGVAGVPDPTFAQPVTPPGEFHH